MDTVPDGVTDGVGDDAMDAVAETVVVGETEEVLLIEGGSEDEVGDGEGEFEVVVEADAKVPKVGVAEKEGVLVAETSGLSGPLSSSLLTFTIITRPIIAITKASAITPIMTNV